MAWLQNLAGKAEDLLNKIDKNAAHVLCETNTSSMGTTQISSQDISETIISLPLNSDNTIAISSNKSTASLKSVVSAENFNPEPDLDESDIIKISDGEDGDLVLNVQEYKPFAPLKTSTLVDNTNFSSKSSSLHNSFIFSEDTQSLEEKITKLEEENQELNKQVLNLRHLYAEIQNENANLEQQVERANESFLNAQLEMEQYRARSHRILQEKEKLINLEKEYDATENFCDNTAMLNEEMKKELEFQIQRNRELTEKLSITSDELTNLQRNYVLLQTKNQETNQHLQELITNERKFRIIAEDDCRSKAKDLHEALQKLAKLHEIVSVKHEEILQLKDQLKQNINYNGSNDSESHLLSLTQTLLAKQTSIETITTERNALRLQLEKLENEYQNLLQTQKLQMKYVNVNDTDDAKSQLPQLMMPSPLDAVVTRRVKHAYSTLDAISIRSGVFLRRYPVARVFVFCYMVLLHMWVLIILCTYIPNNH